MIAIFYHCIVSGGSIPINTGFVCGILAEQMDAMFHSGLLDEADELHIGINGNEEDLQLVRHFCPCPHAHYLLHGSGMTSEIPTLSALHRWLPAHRDWLVLYLHVKGATHPGDLLSERWRRRMESAVVWGWRKCVWELEHGREACGSHWLTKERYPALVSTPFFGGNFWFATAQYLLTLPPLPPATWGNRFEAERWIGSGDHQPIVKDFHPGWPSL
jgi:hypothetical protein